MSSETLSQERPCSFDGDLTPREVWWRDHQVWLQERGYKFRPGFMPDWPGFESILVRFRGRRIIPGLFLSSTGTILTHAYSARNNFRRNSDP
jgi:hypothetical protein